MFVSDPVEVTPVEDSKDTEYDEASVTPSDAAAGVAAVLGAGVAAVLAAGVTTGAAVPMAVLLQPATASIPSMTTPTRMLLFIVAPWV